MKEIIPSLALAIIFLSGDCMAQNDEMKKLEWIVDNWISSNGETKSYEHWKKIDDEHFVGGSETVKNGDTLFSESLKLEKNAEGIFYIAYVKHNPAPVKFRLIEVSDVKAVFENPDHDFPRKISYELNDGNLHAWIEGPGKDSKWKKVDFLMTKMR
ncbi:MAG: DUF6265 family protein [Ignavibacteria bacterium]|nr:DUF6265 family protein [Ignavibacteria bacterium]